MTDWNVTEGDPWSVTFRPMEDTRVVRLHVGNFTIVLPALEAHKLGSALHAASGLETTELDSFIAEQGPAFAADVAQRVADASCCGTDIYWCPTAGRMECPAHSGFDVCCERPERHTPLAQFEPQATALLKWWKENRQVEALAEAEHGSITCPRCGKASHNHNDITKGYCGNCHDWTAAPHGGPPGGALAIGTPVVVTHPDSGYTGLRGTVVAVYTDNPAARASGCPIFDVELVDGSMIIIPANAVGEATP